MIIKRETNADERFNIDTFDNYTILTVKSVYDCYHPKYTQK